MGRYKLVLEPWFEGFGHILGCVGTQTKEVVKCFQKKLKKDFWTERGECNARDQPSQVSSFSSLLAMLYEIAKCMFLKLYTVRS